MTEITTSPAGQAPEDTVLVAAAGRSGQTWLCFVLAHLLNARFLEPYCLLRGIIFTGNAYVLSQTQGKLPGRSPSRYDLVVKTHQHPDPFFSLTRKVILIVRDPRDVTTSAWHRFNVMKTTGSDVEEDAQGMALLPYKLPFEKSLKNRIWSMVHGNRTLAIYLVARRWSRFHAAWRRLPFCHIVRYEDLLKQPVESMSGICRHLGIPVDEVLIKSALEALSFAKITGRNAGDEDNKSIMFRKATAGDHKGKLGPLELALVRFHCREEAAHYGYQI
jgi:hypothetical protein